MGSLSNKKGGRRYRDYEPLPKLATNTWKVFHSRAARFERCAAGFEKAADDAEIAKNLHRPLTAPVSEIGFAITPSERLKQHAHHQSSNRIMNLFDALSRQRYGSRFQMKSVIIYNCFSCPQFWLGEIIFSYIY